MNRIRRGDMVQVVTGSDRGRQGRVISVESRTGRLRVEKVRMQKRHLKPGRKGARAGGIVEMEGFIEASNVMLVNGEGQPSRVRIEDRNGQLVRTFVKGGEVVPDPIEG